MDREFDEERLYRAVALVRGALSISTGIETGEAADDGASVADVSILLRSALEDLNEVQKKKYE